MSNIANDLNNEATAIQRCVHDELRRYFEMLDGEPPRELHELVMGQVETALFAYNQND